MIITSIAGMSRSECNTLLPGLRISLEREDGRAAGHIPSRTRERYLIDFGSARRFRQGQARDTQPLGSPGYAAPEQYDRAQTAPQADLYTEARCSSP